MDTDVRRVMLGRVERFAKLSPEELTKLTEELHTPTPELVIDLGTAFAAHDRTVERLIDVAPPELVTAVKHFLGELHLWSEVARLSCASSTIGTFYYQTWDGREGDGETLAVTRDGAVWTERGEECGRYALAMFAATNASDLRARTRGLPPHVIDRGVGAATELLKPMAER